jgi:hypothetical protein
MTIKVGLRALVVGVAMLCGVAAEAATYTLFSGSIVNTGGAIVLPFDAAIPIGGDLSTPAYAVVSANITNYSTPAPSDPFGNQYTAFVGGTANGVNFQDNINDCGPGGGCAPGRFISATVPLSEINNILNLAGSIVLIWSWPPFIPQGPGTFAFSYNVSVALPDGLVPTPLPAAAPMLASVLGIGGLIGWRRKRKQRQVASAT